MKKVIFTLCALFISSQMIFSQTTGKVVYGPGAESSVQQSDLNIQAGDGQVVIYSETTKTGSGYESSTGEPSPANAPMGEQFTIYQSDFTPTSFTITVLDAPDCAGIYTVQSTPIPGSGPGGSTPPGTNITAYIGFPQGNFYFGGAGEGEYLVVVTNTNNSCSPPINPVWLHAWPSIYTPIIVPILAEAVNVTLPSIPFFMPGYTANGGFHIQVTDSPSCSGTYNIFCDPVPNSAPDGSTPPFTVISGYIGFPAGSYNFANAGTGQYHIRVYQTNNMDICNYTENPLEFNVDLTDPRLVPISDWAIAIGISLIVILAVVRFRRLV